MFKRLHAGIKYNKLLPYEKVFNLIYPEFRVRDFLDFAKWFLPPLFFGSLLLIYYFRFNLIHLVSLTVTPVFILVMLLILYLHQGRQALKALTEAEKKLYIHLCECNDHLPKQETTRIDFITEINLAISKGNREFLDRI